MSNIYALDIVISEKIPFPSVAVMFLSNINNFNNNERQQKRNKSLSKEINPTNSFGEGFL